MAQLANEAEIKRKFPEILADTLGIVTDACKQAGISRGTFYNWCEADPDFKRACDDVNEQTIDFVESKLLQGIREGKEASQIFYLKTKAKHRGYIERTEHTGANGAPLQQGGDKPPEELARQVLLGLKQIADRTKLPAPEPQAVDYIDQTPEIIEES